MNKTCCICGRDVSDGNYDRIDTDYYCPACSNNTLVPCPICGTYINPDVDTDFQAPDGTLFCSQECLDITTSTCVGCGNVFYSTNGHICPLCMMEYNNDAD